MKTPAERTVSGVPQVFVEWAEGGEYRPAAREFLPDRRSDMERQPRAGQGWVSLSPFATCASSSFAVSTVSVSGIMT